MASFAAFLRLELFCGLLFLQAIKNGADKAPFLTSCFTSR
jgi:hypothetical protein